MEKINIAEILKDAPKGTKLWSCIHGDVKLLEVTANGVIETRAKCADATFNKHGQYFSQYEDSECILFPSRDCRDWGEFKVSRFPDKALVWCWDSDYEFSRVVRFWNANNNTPYSGRGKIMRVGYDHYDLYENQDDPRFAKLRKNLEE